MSPTPIAPPTSTLLYIEDNLANVKLVERILEARPNIKVLIARCGQLGIELALENSPTMILLDMHLPDMSGHEILHRLRADKRTAATPIVVLSADATKVQESAARQSGATNYLTKPFDISCLLELVDGNGLPGTWLAEQGDDSLTTVLDRSKITALHELGAMSVDGSDKLRQLVGLFLNDTATRLAELAKTTDDVNRTAVLAHSLAGSAANFGAQELADGCSELGRLAKAGRTEESVAMLPILAVSFGNSRTALLAEFGDGGVA